ncbi:MAG: hypothetical protein H7A50_06720 [Akkermansiaceae bacterium]|nr:hypothetical protein [Akkermansiaceae bacterium]
MTKVAKGWRWLFCWFIHAIPPKESKGREVNFAEVAAKQLTVAGPFFFST